MKIELDLEKLKFWKASPQKKELNELIDETRKLKLALLIKDEVYLQKYLEHESFKRSVFATLGAIALAHGGEYYLKHDFTNAVLADETNRTSITNDEEGTIIALVKRESSEPEPDEEGE